MTKINKVFSEWKDEEIIRELEIQNEDFIETVDPEEEEEEKEDDEFDDGLDEDLPDKELNIQ